MPYAKKTYSREEIKVFRIKDMLLIIQSLIKSFSLLNEGSGKDLDLDWVKLKLVEIYGIAEELVEVQMKEQNKKIEEEAKEAIKTTPFK